jgi:hypothetical protein
VAAEHLQIETVQEEYHHIQLNPLVSLFPMSNQHRNRQSVQAVVRHEAKVCPFPTFTFRFIDARESAAAGVGFSVAIMLFL